MMPVIAGSTSAQVALDGVQQRWSVVNTCFGDAAYHRKTLLDNAASMNITIEVVCKLDVQQNFSIQPRH
jgi:putative transposase